MKRLDLLDYGRLLAALSVMAFHYFFNGIRNGKIETITAVPELSAVAAYGYLGVHFFFMISGYVIFFSASGRRASEFLVSRAVRLFPAFWIAVALTSACAMLLAGPSMAVTPRQVLVNLTMVPALFGAPYVDGVYWTLQLELTFYALVLLVLLMGLRERLATLALAWPVAILAVTLTGRSWVPLLGGFYAFFAAGAVLAAAHDRRGPLPILAGLLCAWLCVSAAVLEAAAASGSGISYSAVVVGAVVLLMFAFFMILNTQAGHALRLPGARLAGALTYPIYLVHAHIGYMLLTRLGNDSNRRLVYPLVIAIVLLLAGAVHWAERRLRSSSRALFERLLGRPLAWIEDKVVRLRGA
jgi:peptidoglycan/LPS O-acetylase OafA/YrhL